MSVIGQITLIARGRNPALTMNYNVTAQVSYKNDLHTQNCWSTVYANQLYLSDFHSNITEPSDVEEPKKHVQKLLK